MALTEVALPFAGTTVRRLDIADDGMIWYVNSGRGQLGRYNPKTGEIKEWQSPSGPKSHPYAIVVVDGIVWYNESGQRPDALVRFDPEHRDVPELGDPVGRHPCRHHQAHARDPRGQPAHSPEQHQPDHPGDGEAPRREQITRAKLPKR